MLEAIRIPLRFEARTQAEIEALDVSSVQEGDLVIVAMSPVAVLTWKAAELGNDASLGVIKPTSKSISDAGRWVFSHWVF